MSGSGNKIKDKPSLPRKTAKQYQVKEKENIKTLTHTSQSISIDFDQRKNTFIHQK